MRTATVRVNGAECPLGEPGLLALLRARDIDPRARGVAVAVNGTVVPRRVWARTALDPGDEVEIVKLFAGG